MPSQPPADQVAKPSADNTALSKQAEDKLKKAQERMEAQWAEFAQIQQQQLQQFQHKIQQQVQAKDKEFRQRQEQRIKQSLLAQQEKLQMAEKQEEAEDAFQAFLDQLELSENEEWIIIDGESWVWKIIRCSWSIL